MIPAKLLLKIERARKELLSVGPGNSEELLAKSRKLDKLIADYYRTKLGTENTKKHKEMNVF